MATWRDLQASFTELAMTSTSHWVEIWMIIVDDPWFSMALDSIINRTIPAGASGRAHVVEDLRQHVRMHLCQRLQKEQTLGYDFENGAFKSWMEQIIKNACRDYWRKERRHSQSATVSEELICIAPPEAPQESAEIVERLRLAIARLPADERVVATLLAEGLTRKEMANAMQLTEARVRRLRTHVIEKLRRWLESERPDGSTK